MQVAVDQAGQVHRHQPPRVLRIGVEVGDPLQRLAKRRQAGADSRSISAWAGAGRARARAEEIAVEPLRPSAPLGKSGVTLGAAISRPP